MRLRLTQAWRRISTVDLGAASWRWLCHNRLLTCAILLMFPIGYAFQHRCRYLNGPDEWRWHYMDLYDFWLTWPPALGLAAVGLAVVFGPIWAVAPRLTPAALRRLRLAGLVAFGLYFHWLAFAMISPNGFTHLGMTITQGSSTGYFTDAATIGSRLPALPELLRHYHEFIPALGMHTSAHPPGALLVCHAALRFFETHPVATRAAMGLYQGLGLKRLGFFPWLTDTHIAAATTVGVLVALLGVMSALPLFALVRRALAGRPEAEPIAWCAAWLWIVHPTLIFFEPQFDQAYPGLVAMVLYCGLRGIYARRHPAAWGVASGLLLMLAVFFSFTFLMLAPMLGCLAVVELARRANAWRPREILKQASWETADGRRLWRMVGACVTTAVAIDGVLRLAWGIRLYAIFRAACLHVATVILPPLKRSYPVWLYYNVHDVVFFGGVALAVLALAYCVRMVREGWRSPAALPPVWVAYPFTMWLIDVLGLTPAETGRIWLFLAPGLVWAGGAELVRRSGARWKTSLAVLLIAQMAFYYLCRAKMKFIGW